MPIDYARSLTRSERNARTNLHLGVVLAFTAGAVNAGGFLAIRQYTSHMTGIISSIADNLAIGDLQPVVTGVIAVASFLTGSIASALLVSYARSRNWRSEYGIALLLEACLLLVFGLAGDRMTQVRTAASLVLVLLCFTMGLQNALITKISKSEIRTTHLTGILTDIGIEFGWMIHGSLSKAVAPERDSGSRARLKTLLALGGAFCLGALSGAFGFKRFGYLATVPLAATLMTLALVPTVDDVNEWRGRRG